AGVAHEINNPLAVIATNLDMIIENVDLSHEIAMMTQEARRGVERIQKAMRGLMTVARADDERGLVDVRGVLEKALQTVGGEIADRGRVTTYFASVPPVHANEAQLIYVFMNLLANAAQAIP